MQILRWLAVMTLTCIFGCSGGGGGGGGGGSTGNNQAPVKVLQSIQVTPKGNQWAIGQAKQFTATGTYADNSSEDISASVTWSSSATSVATVTAGGIVTAVAAGTTTITASAAGGISGTADLTVQQPKQLASLSLVPVEATTAAGTVGAFQAMAKYSDGSIVDVSSTAVWSSSNTAVAVSAGNGRFNALAAGITTITATTEGVSASAQFSVSAATLKALSVTAPNNTLTPGQTQQCTATGTFSNNSTQVLNGQVSWQSSVPGVATVDASGKATAVSDGTTTISASFNGISASLPLNVKSTALVSMAVALNTPTLAAGSSRQLSATGTYSDSTTRDLTGSVTWQSSDTGVAIIEGTGVIRGVSAGQATITATMGNVSATSTVTVSPADVTGTWEGTYTIFDDPREPSEIGTYTFSLVITQNGSAVTGSAVLRGIANGTLTGQVVGNRLQIYFSYLSPKFGVVMEDSGTAIIKDNKLESSSITENFSAGYNCSYTFSVTKKP